MFMLHRYEMNMDMDIDMDNDMSIDIDKDMNKDMDTDISDTDMDTDMDVDMDMDMDDGLGQTCPKSSNVHHLELQVRWRRQWSHLKLRPPPHSYLAHTYMSG